MVRLNKKNMNLLKPLAIFTFAFLFHQNISAQQRVWTLRECIDFAMDNNVSIKQGDLGLEATKIVSQQAKLSYIPDGGIQSGYQLSMGHSLDPTTYSFIENTIVLPIFRPHDQPFTFMNVFFFLFVFFFSMLF